MNLLIILSVVWFLSEMILARAMRSTSADKNLDKSSLRIIWISISFFVPAGIFASNVAFARFHIDSLALYTFGIAFIFAGLVIRWWAILTLKRAFTVDVNIAEDQRLVRSGLYKYIRHPAYLGSLLSFLGLSVVFYNWLTMVIIFLPILSVFLYRIKIEERALSDAFADYKDYVHNTRKLVPWIY